MEPNMDRDKFQNDAEHGDPRERMDRLQAEVARISRLLDESTGSGTSSPRQLYSRDAGADELPAPFRTSHSFAPRPRSFEPEQRALERQRAKEVRRMLRQRRMREQYFPADMFADPAWDMLLDLYAARLDRQPVSVSSLCIAAAVPATTALRWIKTMTDRSEEHQSELQSLMRNTYAVV